MPAVPALILAKPLVGPASLPMVGVLAGVGVGIGVLFIITGAAGSDRDKRFSRIALGVLLATAGILVAVVLGGPGLLHGTGGGR